MLHILALLFLGRHKVFRQSKGKVSENKNGITQLQNLEKGKDSLANLRQSLLMYTHWVTDEKAT
jgi:hypothetical protein